MGQALDGSCTLLFVGLLAGGRALKSIWRVLLMTLLVRHLEKGRGPS